MQVDPIKPTLKAPGSKRLKLKYDKLLSSFAFNCNLRRYTEKGQSTGHAFFEFKDPRQGLGLATPSLTVCS